MGIGLLVAARVARITPEAVLRASWPFFVPLLASLGVITAFPALSLWMPTTVYRWFGLGCGRTSVLTSASTPEPRVGS